MYSNIFRMFSIQDASYAKNKPNNITQLNMFKPKGITAKYIFYVYINKTIFIYIKHITSINHFKAMFANPHYE